MVIVFNSKPAGTQLLITFNPQNQIGFSGQQLMPQMGHIWFISIKL